MQDLHTSEQFNVHELKIGRQHMYVLVKLLVGCFDYRLKPTASL
jgi:hypothetical protein